MPICGEYPGFGPMTHESSSSAIASGVALATDAADRVAIPVDAAASAIPVFRKLRREGLQSEGIMFVSMRE